VEASVVDNVEMSVVSALPNRSPASVEVRMLGPLTICRNGVPLVLPSSRKVRALIGYLSVAPQAVPRSQLCELLWEIPNDPRGELRWCLSKVRALLDDPDRHRIEARADTIRLDLTDCFVDATEIARVAQSIGSLPAERLRTLAALFCGDFLDGLEIDRSPGFTGWLTAQRRRFRGCQTALLEHLVETVPDAESRGYLEQWLALAPFDRRVHVRLLTVLARNKQLREGEEHVAATIRLFESEGLDCAPIRAAWRAARSHGERFVSGPAVVPDEVVPVAPRRASIAVMPFTDRSTLVGVRGGAADALAHDVITRLAKLRSLFVIAQGSVFALHDRQIGAEEAGRMLNVDYVAGGSVRLHGKRLTVTTELAETRTARIVWADHFERTLDDAFLVLDEITDRIVASIAAEVETNEVRRAVSKPPNSLDAWQAHHRGLWHMYRFNKTDNEQAQRFFEMAVRLDPTFARAYAGLSFTHFQSAFQGWAKRDGAVERAYEFAGQSLMADDRDPTAHLAFGRALWLRGRHDESVAELEQSVHLSPNFSTGHYALAFVHAQTGDPEAAISFADQSRSLSPFDPMLFAMLGARSMALARAGRFAEAADWGVKAASRPNAHAQVQAIAAFSLALAGRIDEGRAFLGSIRTALPSYSIDDFLAAMQFDPDGEKLFREADRRIGSL
jgi:TolB-like protein/DNA-binding SARP family transcriptional activator